jgi:hypothetical protein
MWKLFADRGKRLIRPIVLGCKTKISAQETAFILSHTSTGIDDAIFTDYIITFLKVDLSRRYKIHSVNKWRTFSFERVS